MTDTLGSPMGWWNMSGEHLLDMLYRVYDGENPDMVYTEEYANKPSDADGRGWGWDL